MLPTPPWASVAAPKGLGEPGLAFEVCHRVRLPGSGREVLQQVSQHEGVHGTSRVGNGRKDAIHDGDRHSSAE